MSKFKKTTIEFEGQQQRIDDLIGRARFHAQTNRMYSMEIIVHLFDHAHQFGDVNLFDACRKLMELTSSPSPYSIGFPHDHAGDDNNRPKTENIPNIEPPYDDSLDGIFDKRVKPEMVKKALDSITMFAKEEHRFWFVVMKVLIHLQWIPANTKIADFLRWASLQYNLGWTTKRQLSFSDIGGDTKAGKVIKNTDVTLWHQISDRDFRDIQKYRNFSVSVKNTFVHVIVGGLAQTDVTNFNAGQIRDRAQFMRKTNELINDGKRFILS